MKRDEGVLNINKYSIKDQLENRFKKSKLMRYLRISFKSKTF